LYFIPIQPVASQSFSVTLAGQSCQINVYQKTWYETGPDEGEFLPQYAVYLDLYVNNALLIGGVICRNMVRIVRDAYFGFIGDLAFYDSQGADDPVASGLGSRFQLIYLEAADLTVASV
jgi:hypothetical protein